VVQILKYPRGGMFERLSHSRESRRLKVVKFIACSGQQLYNIDCSLKRKATSDERKVYQGIGEYTRQLYT
jgi:hypothetical protein